MSTGNAIIFPRVVVPSFTPISPTYLHGGSAAAAPYIGALASVRFDRGVRVIALMPDITPSEFRSQVNGLINLMGGIGGVLAFAAGAYLYGVNHALSFHLVQKPRTCRFRKNIDSVRFWG